MCEFDLWLHMSQIGEMDKLEKLDVVEPLEMEL